MAKRKIPKKKGSKKPGTFQPGQKAAEKWTEKTVLPIIQAMWRDLSSDDEGENPKNPVRANDIKTLGEVCLMNDVTYDQWEYWTKKFKETDSIFRIIKKIEWVIENRMIYSGQFMDIFVLKNKYGYKDKQEVDHTTGGDKIKPSASVSKEDIAELAKQINELD